ncbi:MAG: peptidoglycan editing factor PgeF, partial [Pseudomonadota bacterium]
KGGVSTGIFQSLNGGPGSDDDPDAVQENRRRVATSLGAKTLVTAYQTHSAVAAFVDTVPERTIPADALVTDRPGLAVAVLTADCVPVLFSCDGLVGAAHAGWRGSLGGILEATIDLMENHGASRSSLRAAIGPCLRAPAFEVGDDLISKVMAKYPQAECFFVAGENPGKSIYDHVAFVIWRLTESGLAPDHIEDAGGCTLSQSTDWFSYRACRARNERDYGRNVSAIAISQG